MEEIDKIILKEKEKKLIMSRVPPQTKKLFIDLAENEFVGDYGLTLKAILDAYFMNKIYFENIDMKLDKLIELNSVTEQEPESNEIQLLSGRIVRKGGKN